MQDKPTIGHVNPPRHLFPHPTALFFAHHAPQSLVAKKHHLATPTGARGVGSLVGGVRGPGEALGKFVRNLEWYGWLPRTRSHTKCPLA